MSTIPRVCLCAMPRTGSSMMMACLKAGGLVVDADTENEYDMALFRNPGGLFFSRKANYGQQFVNSFKLIGTKHLADVPKDYKFIRLVRPEAEMVASWYDVETRGIAQGRAMEHKDVTAVVSERKAKWDAAMASVTHLVLEYNAVVADSTAAMQAIANYINTPEFSFNVAAAAAVVDANLYIRRTAP